MTLIENEITPCTSFLSREKFEDRLEDFLVKEDHPCIMAQTVRKLDKMTYHLYDDMRKNSTAGKLLKHLEDYLNNYDFNTNKFESFLAVFPLNGFNNEEEFENALWQLLQNIHLQDNEPWDPSVSSNPNDPNFSFSIKGKAFYIVGMHPSSSRNARKSPYVMLAFNLHWQFEELRRQGLYDNVRDTIRQRDLDKNGSINPVLKDFGTASEALQYSGRNNGANWKCPFHKI
ncbi:guanitoxin biosynthesis heme-dependent pre-guanitoxin N-hydroxylase GntA [Croceivirga radicis]|uniref:guanitoxin biosynthesis heme-dependent pre-guanitoxin N-hydroxylase GntA n=1 Tax=Croceivirga radicis TaxID=1929488 RepID=UPI000255AE2D|nr:guanitoxin biosynthesis heme-dependent pre-guanitoxin N-hydroxylase GntA [Croceivirga radicis]